MTSVKCDTIAADQHLSDETKRAQSSNTGDADPNESIIGGARHSNPWQAYTTVIGGFIYMLRLGSEYMSSSIAPYIASYYAVETKQAQIILPSLFVVNMFLSPIGAQAAQQIHPKMLLFTTGVLGLSLVLAATYQTEFWRFTALYVGGFGMTNAMTYMVPVHHGWLWFPRRPGLVSGLIICGFGFGALIFNNVSRAIVNPNNESADDDGKFSDDVNQRVPLMLRVVLACFMVMTLVAIALMSPGPLQRAEQSSADCNEGESIEEQLIEEIISAEFSNTGIEAAYSQRERQVNMTMDSIDQRQEGSPAMVQATMRRKQRRRKALRKKLQRIKLCMALKSGQFWLVYAMACLSILFGYYTIDVYKMFGQTYELLNHDAYLTWMGSLGSVFTSLRFLWSAALDSHSYKLVYGILLLIQISLAITMFIGVQNKVTYGIWICMALFCEGGHFTLVPNVLKKIYGSQATSLYGITLTYTGLTSLVMITLLETSLSQDYLLFYLITAGSSFVALCILLFGFSEERFDYKVSGLRSKLQAVPQSLHTSTTEKQLQK